MRTPLISHAVVLRQPALVIGSQLTPQSMEAAGTGTPIESMRLSSQIEPAPPGQPESLEHHRTQYCAADGPRQVNPAAHMVDASQAWPSPRVPGTTHARAVPTTSHACPGAHPHWGETRRQGLSPQVAGTSQRPETQLCDPVQAEPVPQRHVPAEQVSPTSHAGTQRMG